MKSYLSAILAILIYATNLAQVPINSVTGSGIIKKTNKKFYVLDGKISSKPSFSPINKSTSLNEYQNYYDVELYHYGMGDTNLVPSYYMAMNDSLFTFGGTAFTHIFDTTTGDFLSFDSLYAHNGDSITIDSVELNFGHVNHSGLPNKLILTIRELAISNTPQTNGAILWTDTVTMVNFTPGMGINQLPYFSFYVGQKLPYMNRGVYVELAFEGVGILDSASFIANFWKASSPLCNIRPFNRNARESFTLREKLLPDGRTFFRHPVISSWYSQPPTKYWSNLNLFRDCNSSSTYEKGTNEAYWIQNISQGIWFNVHGYTVVPPPPPPVKALFSKAQAMVAGNPVPGQLVISDLSTGNNLNYLWDFGDGATSTLQNPTHTYSTNGPYVLCLTVNDSLTTDTYCDTLSVDSNGIISKRAKGFGITVGTYVPINTNGIDVIRNIQLDVFPNPTKNELQIHTELNNYRLSIYNSHGQLMLQENSSGNKIIDVSLLRDGIYFINCQIEKSLLTKKFVISR